MTAPPRPPTISILIIDATGMARPPAALQREAPQAQVAEIIPVIGRFDQLAPAFAAALARCVGELVFTVTPDVGIGDEDWQAIASALQADPDAVGFRMRLRGLRPGREWRGRRFRSHERNLESLRFAHIIAPGALVARRDALAAALADVPADAGGDWWRLMAKALARTGRIVELDSEVRRSRLLDHEPPIPSLAPTGKTRVLVFGQIEVSTSLYFDAFEERSDVDIAFRPLTRLEVDATALAGADLVVLVRELHRFWDEGVIHFLDAAAVPYVWFADDNFQALRREGLASPFYVEPRMRAALAGAAAVWASTPALAAAHVWLHPHVESFGPTLDPALQLPPPRSRGTLVVAIPGGDFRLHGVDDGVVDELRQLSESRGISILASEAATARLRAALPRAEFMVMRREWSYRQHLRQLHWFAPDILLHPAGATANTPYKAPTAAIGAGYIGAIPVVADEPAYDAWREAQGVLRLSEGGLTLAAEKARDNPYRAEMRQRLLAAVEARFLVGDRPQRFIALARRSRGRNIEAAADNILAAAAFNRRRLALRWARLTRRLRDRIRPPE